MKTQQVQAVCTNSSSGQIAGASVRLVSIDALRGFDMLWIIGADRLVRVSAKVLPWPWLQWLAGQMKHPRWEGFTCYDLIFPLFLFLAGVSIPFSLCAKKEQGLPKWRLYEHIFRRMFLLVLFGIIYNGGLELTGVTNTRFASVLGLIGIGYCVASLIALNFSYIEQAVWFAAIIVGYWFALFWIPVPNFGAGIITPEGSLASYIDQRFLPGKLYGGTFDPEGIMSCISGISMALGGAIAGHWLRIPKLMPKIKVAGLFIAGIVCVTTGIVWGRYLPIIKHIWTGSFVILALGLSLFLLGLFYLIIDVIGLKKWAILFTVVGMNSITIYMAVQFVNFNYTAKALFGGFIHLVPQSCREILMCLAVLFLEWLFLYVLYRRKIFLRL
jgi:predicted acyltransferase